MSFEIPSLYTAHFSLHVIQAQSLFPVISAFEKKAAMWERKVFLIYFTTEGRSAPKRTRNFSLASFRWDFILQAEPKKPFSV